MHFYAIFFPFLLFSASYMHVHTSARLLTYMRVRVSASACTLAQKKFFYFSQLWTKFLKILFTSLLVSANMSSACPPSSRVSPICHSAKPYGQGNTRRAHIKRRRLIMPLVALVQKNHSAPATSYFRLVLGTRFGRRRCSSSSVFERASAYLRTPAYTKCGKTAIFG